MSPLVFVGGLREAKALITNNEEQESISFRLRDRRTAFNEMLKFHYEVRHQREAAQEQSYRRASL